MITGIIPDRQSFYNKSTRRLTSFDFKSNDTLDLESICIFTALGFFMGDTTYFQNTRVLKPASEYKVEDNRIEGQHQIWSWQYNPRDISFDQTVEEFSHLYQKISKEQVTGKRVILPLSGGLDSRSQAVVLGKSDEITAYSYEFENGINENKYGRAIAREQGYKYTSMMIPKSYLWPVIEDLAKLNHCLSDFTHQRQMAVKSQYQNMGNLFFLGHWGDVLFDDMGVPDRLSDDEITETICIKVLKKGGKDIGMALWEAWGLKGSFIQALRDRISGLLTAIKIDHANAKVRAFKSLYWAPRWTSVNLCVFQDSHDVALPYYHNEMCKYICTVPEEFLAGRKIQIAYIKKLAPDLAKIPWQNFDPCNLYNYHDYYSLKYLPVRAFRNIKRNLNQKIFGKSKLITRNWEIQFVGKENERQLKEYLFKNKPFQEWVPESLTRKFFNKFKEEDDVFNAHPLSMLLTLSVFAKLRNEDV